MAPDQPPQNAISLKLPVSHFLLGYGWPQNHTNSSQPLAEDNVAPHSNKPSAVLVHILP